MPFVTETLRHDSFLDDLFYKVFRRFEDKDGNKWWMDINDKAPKIDLYKITFEKGLFVSGVDGYRAPRKPKEGNICITRHMIIRRWDNELLGFAQSTGSVKINTASIPTDHQGLMTWLVNSYKEFINYTTLYAYTLEGYEGYTHFEADGGEIAPVTILTDDSGAGVHKASLDVEFHSEDEYYPDMKQSPIITMDLKGDTGSQVAAIGKLNYKTNTNWWDDSLIQLKGVFDETSAYFTLKVDSAPNWEDNMVALVPFFYGNLVTKESQSDATKRNATPIAMFGGTQVDKFFDFDSIDETTELLQPITRNYTSHPSNGVDTIMVKKTKYGARYQEHFLSWNVPPNQMPPTREEIRLVGEDIKSARVHATGNLPEVIQGIDATINLGFLITHPKAADYVGATYVVINDEEVTTLKSVDLVNSTITLTRKTGKEWAAGTQIKAYTSDALASITRKYPRAWNYLRFGYYQYGFHPSRYSDKIHTSRATVMHPEDGIIGHIPNIVLLPAINVMDGDKLKFPYWCADCDEELYSPEVPTTPPPSGWSPVPSDDPHGGNDDPNESNDPDKGSFTYLCDNSVAPSTVDSTYWNPSTTLQGFVASQIGRELSREFWQGRNDWLDLFGNTVEPDGGKYLMTSSKVTIKNFHAFLWKAVQDVKSGKETNSSTWTAFNTWAKTDLSCLTELERASLFMSTKLAKPVLFFPSSEGFLAGDILDKMIPAIEKVPTEVYDFMDFNNVYVEAPNSGGIVGAWVRDAGIMATSPTGVVTDAAPTFKSMVSFEPQLLQYSLGAAKANRPYDYIKNSTTPNFGSPIVGGEYTSYYQTEMTDTNFTPFVAAEVAVHEMAHALSNYGRDVLGKVLHEMPDWLSISWGVDSTGKWDGISAKKTKPGTLLDNGKLAPVSDYGCFQPAEDFAESFMMYVINRPFLKDKFRAKHDFIATKLQAMGINPNL